MIKYEESGEVKKVISIIKSIITKKETLDTKEVLNLPPLKNKTIAATITNVNFLDNVSK